MQQCLGEHRVTRWRQPHRLASKDAARLGRFYAEVFDAEVGPTRDHGQDGNETMTIIRIGPHTELNIFVIKGNTERDRQTPTWGRGRIDHFGLQAALPEAFATIWQRLIDHGASDGTINDFGPVHSIFFRDPGRSRRRGTDRQGLAGARRTGQREAWPCPPAERRSDDARCPPSASACLSRSLNRDCLSSLDSAAGLVARYPSRGDRYSRCWSALDGLPQ
jgi:hypothetical protein